MTRPAGAQPAKNSRTTKKDHISQTAELIEQLRDQIYLVRTLVRNRYRSNPPAANAHCIGMADNHFRDGLVLYNHCTGKRMISSMLGKKPTTRRALGLEGELDIIAKLNDRICAAFQSMETAAGFIQARNAIVTGLAWIQEAVHDSRLKLPDHPSDIGDIE